MRRALAILLLLGLWGCDQGVCTTHADGAVTCVDSEPVTWP